VVVVHSLATKTDNTLWSWGSGSNGRLGQNNTTQFSSPVQIPGTSWSSISAGDSHSLATKTDNHKYLKTFQDVCNRRELHNTTR
jgi:alpha-tubulin suppressor-like RCC1 family protein